MTSSHPTSSVGAAEYYALIHECNQLEGIRALLDWDQQTYMPSAGAETKANQLEYVAVLMHQKMTGAAFEKVTRDLLEKSAADTDSADCINARFSLKQIEREKKLSSEFVAEKTRLQSETFQLWQKAKTENNFPLVQPHLARLFEITRKEADLVGYQEHVYDALLDQYEPDGRISWVKPLLVSLAEELKKLLAGRFDAASEKIKKAPAAAAMPIEMQKKLCEHLMVAFGLPTAASRLDVSSHPFCTTIGHDDMRITSRFREDDFLYGLGSLLHELGHALYEYHLPKPYRGTACGSVYSLGMHESQSRLIENCVGRSKSFAEYLAKTCKDRCKQDISAEEIYKSQNFISSSLIRVDADEVTYSLHIVIRMLLEIDLLTCVLPVKDLPEAWKELYCTYLDIVPTTDTQGVLQDVHWFSGAIGYFPTYALGNVYDGMLLQTLKGDLPNFDSIIQSGEFAPISTWLKANVHVKATQTSSRSLMKNITGQELSSAPFVQYIAEKLSA